MTEVITFTWRAAPPQATEMNSNTIYRRNMACFKYITVSTVHTGDNK